MILNNARVIVTSIDDQTVTLESENGGSIKIPRELLPDAAEGAQLYIALDSRPLTSSEKKAKEILNEIISE